MRDKRSFDVDVNDPSGAITPRGYMKGHSMDDDVRTLPILCEHQWQDSPYPIGVMLVVGTFGDMSEETRQRCSLCGALRFVRTGLPFSLAEVMEEPREEGTA